ncbi:hypothetical protein SAMN04487886_11059 [Clostridium sp. DSM 8431]|nr:hypothetical protein SAMN04487886_11059 [Clostridium sp. DSM 8431]
MPYIINLKHFIKSKRLAIKSCYFTCILLLVFISAIIMITSDYTQTEPYTNTITTNTNIKSIKNFNSQDKKVNTSKNVEVLRYNFIKLM